ncbi:phage holin family protein [Paenibacillus pasadenensis]|uniref:phage holin family protein n=1 Tax=Paenibacillus pasadenensis TaxID=217090 RepID=UPI0020415CA8|nr:phage holin family protein [Paenibacillus pasadenensis]MCM3747471.1 phage holin family protein [Paenibacillus pasadenensis]
MDWTFINALIRPELGGVLAVCWIVGYILKQTPRVPDWSIVYAVTVVGVLMACLLLGGSVESIIQGVLCGAVAVYGYQLIKQTAKGASGEGGHNERK